MTQAAQFLSKARRLSGKHVLAVFVAMFGTIFAVNGYMAYMAISTFSGVDGEDSYRRGLDYNTTIAAASQQEALGWTANVAALPQRQGLELVVTDKSGLPMTGQTVHGVIARPSTNRFDRAVTLLETAPGHYQTTFVSPLETGNWIADLTVTSPISAREATHFQLRQRLWLK